MRLNFEPRPPDLGAQSLSHWATREVPVLPFFLVSLTSINCLSINKDHKGQFASYQPCGIVKDTSDLVRRAWSLNIKSPAIGLWLGLYFLNYCSLILKILWIIPPSSQSREGPMSCVKSDLHVSCISCIGRWVLYHSTTWEGIHGCIPL